MIVDAVSTRRLAVCRTCQEWSGSCRLGHAINSASACPKGLFPGFLALGDVVAWGARPIATVSDLLLGTNLRSCPACARRQARLNHTVKR